jgi:hypothetical protein
MDYSLQPNQTKLEGSQHADRNHQQFEYINRKAQRCLKQAEPVISPKAWNLCRTLHLD